MTTERAIRHDAPGTDFDLTLTINNVPIGSTLTDAWLTVRDASGAQVLQLVIDVTSQPQGQVIDADGNDGVATALFQLSQTDTEAITANTTYSYDVWVRSSNASEWQAFRGSWGANYPRVTTGV